ncbi:MAG: hypothetical protein JRH08_00875 [Deltaproteobacteria bacterium]|nr:hypothetical protein [Deltaproteobacteria bacterium]MBW2025716.1 hypothetical protein [Deltaproteobacteria bacterium]MBW2124257.1 hypothetical protein [Deltaproteobacteria bacterium]
MNRTTVNRERQTRMLLIPIDDILRTTANGVQVLVSHTGKPAWVPRNHVLFIPHAMIVPEWLGRRLLFAETEKPPQTAPREPAVRKSRHDRGRVARVRSASEPKISCDPVASEPNSASRPPIDRILGNGSRTLA